MDKIRSLFSFYTAYMLFQMKKSIIINNNFIQKYSQKYSRVGSLLIYYYQTLDYLVDKMELYAYISLSV